MLIVKQGIWSAECKNLILVMQAFEFSGVEYYMCKPFVAESVSKLIEGSSLAYPLSKRVFMKWVGSKGCPIEVERPGLTDEEQFGLRWKVLFYKRGRLVVVDRSLGIFGAWLLSKSDLP